MFSQQRPETGLKPQYYISNFTSGQLQKPAKGQLLVELGYDFSPDNILQCCRYTTVVVFFPSFYQMELSSW